MLNYMIGEFKRVWKDVIEVDQFEAMNWEDKQYKEASEKWNDTGKEFLNNREERYEKGNDVEELYDINIYDYLDIEKE